MFVFHIRYMNIYTYASNCPLFLEKGFGIVLNSVVMVVVLASRPIDMVI